MIGHVVKYAIANKDLIYIKLAKCGVIVDIKCPVEKSCCVKLVRDSHKAGSSHAPQQLYIACFSHHLLFV